MKQDERPGFGLNQIVIAALAVVGAIGVAAMFSGYTGLIEFQCSAADGCRVVIDGRPD